MQLERNGVRLHVDDHGAGRPLVLVHGVWMSGRYFARQLPLTEDGLRLVIPDLRGHGRSEDPGRGHTVPGYADDVHHLLERLDLRDVVLVGWSMGAMVCWELLHRYGSERVSGLVVVDEGPAEFAWPGWTLGSTSIAELAGAVRLIQESWEAAVEGFLPTMFAREPAADDLAWMIRESLQVNPTTASTAFVDQTLWDGRELVASLDVPTLLCFGASERVAPVAAGRWIAERASRSELALFEQSDHCPHLEEPERFNALVRDFATT